MLRGLPALTVFAVFLGFGVLLGVLGLCGWRYATPFGGVVDVGIPRPPPPPLDEGTTGYMYVVDGYSYLDGPHWFPATVWFLAGGMLGEAITAAALLGGGWRLARRTGGRRRPLVGALTVFGGLSGVVVAAAGRWAPPLAYSVVLPEPRDPENPYPVSDLAHVELGPTWLTFPALGLAAGAAVGGLLCLSGLRATRTGDSTLPPQ